MSRRLPCWTDADLRTLRLMRESGASYEACGVAVGRSAEAARQRWIIETGGKAYRSAAAEERPTERRCLCGCGRKFGSRHAGERIAPECRGMWSRRAP